MSIQQNGGILQPPTRYSYALKTTPQTMQRMSRDELLALCLEQYFLLTVILRIVYNAKAAVTSRLVAIDLIVEQVKKVVSGKLQSVTERSPTYLPAVEKRLGIHENTVSKGYHNLEKHLAIERAYRVDPTTQHQHLDINPTSLLLTQPEIIRDKTVRQTSTALPTKPESHDTNETELHCSSCGSANVQIVCRDCGAVEIPDRLLHSTVEEDNKNCAESQRHKFCGNGIINNPPEDGLLQEVPLEHSEQEPTTPSGCEAEDGHQACADGMIARDGTSPLLQDGATVADEHNDPDTILSTWLEKRKGSGQLIYATGNPAQDQKYKSKSHSYQPNMQAYLTGHRDHIYGSRLQQSDGTTFVLSFDLDKAEENAAHTEYMQALAMAGASPLYWQRQNHKGHLELYFDTAVDPKIAYRWCVGACPALAEVEECYPVKASCVHLITPTDEEGAEPTDKLCPVSDRSNHPLSWPLYQRQRNIVVPCPVVALLASRPGELVTHLGIAKDRQGLASLISQAVTPASLLSSVAAPAQEHETPSDVALEDSPGQTGRARREPSDADLAKVVIAAFNREHTWEEVARLCGGLQKDRFCAVWRGEKTPSVVIDANGEFAADYGRRAAANPFKLDRYEVWCLAQGGREFKRFDLAQRIAAHRAKQRQQGSEVSPPLVQRESAEETRPELSAAHSQLQPHPEETADEVVERLRLTGQHSRGRVMTPAGPGKLWQVWTTRIGVVLDSDQEHVRFFTNLDDRRAIVALEEPAE